jgi:3-oxoacyl-[acyl-carrier-protein] synthase I
MPKLELLKGLAMIITAVNSITPVGHSAEMTAASVRAGISRLAESEEYFDLEGNPVTVAQIEAISDDEDEVARANVFAQYCLASLLDKCFRNEFPAAREINLLVGVASSSRPGPRYEGEIEETINSLMKIAQNRAKKLTAQVIKSGNASVIRGLEIARQLLAENPQALCIIGGMDCLLAPETLDWFEDAERLKSETFGRNQGFIPGEAVSFMVVQSKQEALNQKKHILAEIIGMGLAREPAPFLSERPSKGEGLTQSCRVALAESACDSGEIAAVFSDLNGEFFRAKEWGYAELRCFGNLNDSRQLWHPADCLGSVGAASGAVLINLAAVGLSRRWISKYAMVFCSDDEGECGAVVLKSYSN